MSYGPYTPYGPPPGNQQTLAASKVGPPAIALLVLGVLNLLPGLLFLFVAVVLASGAVDVPQGPDEPPLGLVAAIYGVWGLAVLVTAAVIILGAMKMKSMTSYGWAIAASILAMIPGISCCLIGLPLGIWAVVVLSNPEVKAGFR